MSTLRLSPIIGGPDDGKFEFEARSDDGGSWDVHMTRSEVVSLMMLAAGALGIDALVIPPDVVL